MQSADKLTQGRYREVTKTTVRKMTSEVHGSPPDVGTEDTEGFICTEILKYDMQERLGDYLDSLSYSWVAVWKPKPKPKDPSKTIFIEPRRKVRS